MANSLTSPHLASTHVEKLFQRYGPSYRWLVTATVLLGLVAMGMSITIVNVATPYIKGSFGMSDDQVQWLSTGFLAATTVSLLIAPWLVEAFGQRATYIGVLIVFMGASLLGGFADGMTSIVIARVIQGAMTGIVRPVALEALFSVFSREQRGMATAMYGMSLGLPLTLATVLGGWLVDEFSWRYVFFITLPICGAALVMGWFFLPRREANGPVSSLDWWGVLLLFTAIFSGLAALSNGQRWGWSSDAILSLFALAGLTLAIFIVWEKKCADPLLDLEIFRHRGFLVGSISLFLFGGVFYGVMYLLPQFVHQILHYDPVSAGALFLPSTLVLAVLVPIVGKLSDRYPAHYLTLPGLAFALWAAIRFSGADWHTSFNSLALSMALLSVAMAAFPPPTLVRSIGALPDRLIGYGSGAINFALQLGGAFTTAALVTLIDRRRVFHSDNLVENINAGNQVATHALHQMQSALALSGVSPDQQAAGARHLLGAIAQIWPIIFAYQDGFTLMVAGLFLIVLPSWLLGRWSRPQPAFT